MTRLQQIEQELNKSAGSMEEAYNQTKLLEEYLEIVNTAEYTKEVLTA